MWWYFSCWILLTLLCGSSLSQAHNIFHTHKINNQVSRNHTHTNIHIGTDTPDSYTNHTRIWYNDNLQRETKKEQYRQLLLQVLQHHQQAHRRFLETVRTRGLTEVTLQQWLITSSRMKTKSNDLLTFLMGGLTEASPSSPNFSSNKRRRRSQGGMMYLPVGGTTQVQCPTAADAAGVSITQMAFLTICLTVFNIIVNINNNINNNNNNNNINSDNNLSNNNAQLSLNVNNGAQVNVMLPPPIPGRRKRATLRDNWHQVLPHTTTSDSLDHILHQVVKEKQSKQHLITYGKEIQDTNQRKRDKRKKLMIRRQREEVINLPNSSYNTGQLQEGVGVRKVAHDAVNLTRRTKQGFAGVAERVMTVVVTGWMKESPLASPACRGLHLCRNFTTQRHLPRDVWLNVLASFVTHQRVTGATTSLHHFVRSAVTGQGCRHLFPECKQTLVS
ncbi:homeobox protein 5-like [Homarus americanus]|uniref:homeobox protein 5-like n=1 Tax=Homarus americanus TaxID=6706 RepID=UPI001C473C26|nr:homeobox protein 5-like [Homarus americanus]